MQESNLRTIHSLLYEGYRSARLGAARLRGLWLSLVTLSAQRECEEAAQIPGLYSPRPAIGPECGTE